MTGRPPYDPRDIWQQGEDQGPPRLPRRARQQAPSRRAQRPRRRWLGIATFGGLAVACFALGVVVFLVVASPLDAMRDRLIERVNARIGGTLAVSGSPSLSIFPRAVVAFHDVAVLTPEGGKAAPIATVPSLEVEVSLWSLVLRQPQVGRLTLHRPVIALSVDAEGRRNWETVRRAPTPAAAGAAADRAPSAPAETGAPFRPVSAAQKIDRGSVRILDATLHYRDARSGEDYEVTSLNFELAAEDREGPVAVEGTLTWRGVPVSVSGKASPLRMILAGEPVEL